MRVGLNATCFNDRPSGANQRFFGIYGALIRRNPDMEFVVYEPCDQRIAKWFGDAANVTAQVTPIPSVGRLARLRAGLGYWNRALRADRLDIFEAFHLPLQRAPDCPTILTIHDLRPILPDQPVHSRLLAKATMRHAFSRADHVIAVSDAVADEIRAFYPATRVSTVYNGVDPAAFVAPSAEQVASVRQHYAIPADYVLAVGHLEARKNLPLLIEAIAVLRDRGSPLPLVVVGNDGGNRQAIAAMIARHNLADLVTLVAQADDAAVRALYAGCRLLAFPSRYEGFGIPILEAMAAGKPMALADTVVFRELTADKGAYFPLDDARAAADAIAHVWHSPEERQRQVEFGKRRLQDFGFDRLADQVSALYRTLA